MNTKRFFCTTVLALLLLLPALDADARGGRVFGDSDSFRNLDKYGTVQFLLDSKKRIIETGTDHETVTVQQGAVFVINGKTYTATADTDVILADLDTGTTTAGTDYYVYAVQNSGLDFVVSANSTWPDGYTADTSTKIGGFHLLCASVGTIGGHTLTDYMIGDILPASIWDLRHRPICSPEGMVYSSGANIWVDIYLASGTGTNTASAFGGTISDNRDWMDFVDDFAAVDKQLLDDSEFQIVAAGSNEETNIAGSADPVTTGGHSDTAGRRMISNIGVEDACGAMYQWLRDQSYRFDTPTAHHHSVTVSGAAETVDTSSSGTAIGPTWEWHNLAGAKGSLYRQGSYGDVKLLAGGYWSDGAAAGSRSRSAGRRRWDTNATFGARGRSLPK